MCLHHHSRKVLGVPHGIIITAIILLYLEVKLSTEFIFAYLFNILYYIIGIKGYLIITTCMKIICVSNATTPMDSHHTIKMGYTSSNSS